MKRKRADWLPPVPADQNLWQRPASPAPADQAGSGHEYAHPAPPVPAVQTAGPGAYAPDRPIRPREEPQHPLKRILGYLVVVGALALKFGKVAVLFLGKAKFLTTSASMLVSVAAYAFIWGWKFAVGFVALLFIHEMGHYIQLRREGVKPSGMLFIPFLGAVVGARSLGGSALAEARVGLAGPVLGTIGAALCIPLAEATGNDLFKALAFVGFFLNLINLVPVVPLDGGRAFAAMAPWMWFVGLAVTFVAVFTFPSPVLILIAIVALFTTWGRWKNLKKGEEDNPSYYDVQPKHRLAVGAVYVGLIILLAIGMDATFIERDFSDV